MNNKLFTIVNKHGARTVVYENKNGFLCAANGAKTNLTLGEFVKNGGRVDNSPHPIDCQCNIHEAEALKAVSK